MKNETTSSAKATPKPKAGEKKATVKKKADSNPTHLQSSLDGSDLSDK
ncbi:hypothetical protein [Duncaniella muris]